MLCLRTSGCQAKPAHARIQTKSANKPLARDASVNNVVSSLPWSSKISMARQTYATAKPGSTGSSTTGAGTAPGSGERMPAGQTLMEFEGNRVVALADLPAEEIKLDLANNLLKEELQILDDFEELSFHNAIGKRFLQESKFKFVDNNDGTATLSRNDGVHNVRVTIKTYEQPQEEENQQNEGDQQEEEGEGEYEGEAGAEGQEQEEEGQDEEGAEEGIDRRGFTRVIDSDGKQVGKKGKQQQQQPHKGQQQQEQEEGEIPSMGGIKSVSDVKEGVPEGEPLPKRQDFVADIEFLKKGKAKGTWRLHCFSGHQNRLYVDNMQVTDGVLGAPKNLEDMEELVVSPTDPNLYAFDTLTVETQDRIYDLLDKLGLDDQLSHFVKQYPIRKKSSVESQFLNRLKELLSSSVPSDYKPSAMSSTPPPPSSTSSASSSASSTGAKYAKK